MLIEEKDNPRKLVLFWISKEEANDPELKLSINKQLSEWKEKKYTPVILESGNGNLESDINMLLKHNYEIVRKRESKSA